MEGTEPAPKRQRVAKSKAATKKLGDGGVIETAKKQASEATKGSGSSTAPESPNNNKDPTPAASSHSNVGADLRSVLGSRVAMVANSALATAQLQGENARLREENATQLQQIKTSAEYMAQLCNAVQQRELEIMMLRTSHESVVHELRMHATQMFQLYEQCIAEHHKTSSSEPNHAKESSDSKSHLEPDAEQYFLLHHPQLLNCPSCRDHIQHFQSQCLTFAQAAEDHSAKPPVPLHFNEVDSEPKNPFSD